MSYEPQQPSTRMDCIACGGKLSYRITHAWPSNFPVGVMFCKYECSDCHVRKFEKYLIPIEEPQETRYSLINRVCDLGVNRRFKPGATSEYCDRCFDKAPQTYQMDDWDLCVRCCNEIAAGEPLEKRICTPIPDPVKAPTPRYNLECGLCGEVCNQLYPIDDGMVCEQCKRFCANAEEEKAMLAHIKREVRK